MIELASALRAEVDRAAAYFRSLGETDVTRSRGTGKWVKKEILGHMIGDHEPTSLEWWMRDYLRHLKHHLEQLEAA